MPSSPSRHACLISIANFFVTDWFVFAGIAALIAIAVILGTSTRRGREIRDVIRPARPGAR